ncbi:hypothetical protein BGZ58_000919 [Dissophora ornata]|nr:hypothetical protein BGZ58_000919 [Dissophora ornata]
MSSTIGKWNNTSPVANMTAIRWEGKTPDTDTPGTLSPTAWPPGMAVQTKVPNADGGSDSGKKADSFQMDPSKGRIVVGLVSAILIIGVLIGVLQVYNAAQYVPPPKIRVDPSRGQVGGKKVKKNQAYYKKPAKDDQSSMLLMASGVGNGSNRSSLAAPMMQERSGNERFSVASVSSSTVNHKQQQQQRGREDLHGAVLIDMQDTTTPSTSSFRRPWTLTGRASSSATSSSTAADLIQFGNDGSTPGSPYQTSDVEERFSSQCTHWVVNNLRLDGRAGRNR